jgi:hypothetical protein
LGRVKPGTSQEKYTIQNINSSFAYTFSTDLTGTTTPDQTWTNNAAIFSIDGNIGDNDTKTQFGGLVPLSAGGFGLTFSTSAGHYPR